MLKEITVIELGRIFSAPLVGKTLADLGAKVIKIERKDIGDESRHYGLKLNDEVSDYFFALNYNKELISLDLKNPDDLKTCYRLLETADVLIHNSLPKSIEGLGLSYDIVKKINPRIIYASISGYGHQSKFKNDPSQDMTIQGLSGFMSLNGFLGGVPLKTGVPVLDYITGMNLVTGILAALYGRKTTNQGMQVNCSLLETSIGLMAIESVRYLNLGEIATRNGNRHYSIAPYSTYLARDGYINIAIANDEMFKRFTDVLGIDILGFETNLLRLQKIDELDNLINQSLSKYKLSEIIFLLKEHKISCGPVNDIASAFNSPEVKELSLIKEKDNLKYIKTPINFD